MDVRNDHAGPVSVVLAAGGTTSAATQVPGGMGSVLVEVPTVVNGAITLMLSHDGSTFYDYYLDNTQAGMTGASTGQRMFGSLLHGQPTHLKIKSGATQTSAVTFRVSYRAA